jgi:DNA polymerase-1
MTQYNPWWPEGEYAKIEERAGTNMQNFPRMEGIRDCIRPRDGFWWCSVDYDSLELRSFAQILLWIVGRSVMAERYQADPNYDPHTELAGRLMGLSYADAMKLKKAGDKSLKEKRQLAKAANFGYPGGLGAKRFIDYARAGYGVEITVAQAYELKEQWMNAFPEVAGYFEYISWLTETGTPFKQFVSNRIRGRVGFTDGCNSGFQGLAADGAKRALIAVTQACYVEPTSPLYASRVVAFIHDEICTEVPIQYAHEAAMEQVRLMEKEMQVVIKDVPIKASPALSTRWLKAAEAKFDKDRLTAWDL